MSDGGARHDESRHPDHLTSHQPAYTENRTPSPLLRRASTVVEANLAARFGVVLRATADFREIPELDGRGAQTFTSWLEEHVHPDDRDLVRAAVDEAVGDAAVLKVEHRILRADGTTGWTVSRAVPLAGPTGQVAEWLVVSGGRTDDATARGDRAAEAG